MRQQLLQKAVGRLLQMFPVVGVTRRLACLRIHASPAFALHSRLTCHSLHFNSDDLTRTNSFTVKPLNLFLTPLHQNPSQLLQTIQRISVIQPPRPPTFHHNHLPRITMPPTAAARGGPRWPNMSTPQSSGGKSSKGLAGKTILRGRAVRQYVRMPNTQHQTNNLAVKFSVIPSTE